MKIQESGENYLETILLLKQKNGDVRSIDVANELNYSRPSISRAMSLLRQADYISMDNFGKIELTEKGENVAKEVRSRHDMLATWLKSIGVSDEIAETDACRIEHVISPETFEKLKINLGM